MGLNRRNKLSINIWISRIVVISLNLLTRCCYRFEVKWVQPPPPDAWKDVRVFAFLNHTSLMEPLFLGALPLGFLWDAATRTTVPGADITMNRRFAGAFYKAFAPRSVAISRKRDDSWQAFLEQIQPTDMVALAPEGRMMRANGLDKAGKPMSVRGGIADILHQMGQGRFLIGYSGGLHHVNQPGQKGFKLFKTLRINFELLDIEDYLSHFASNNPEELRALVARDLEARLHQHKPTGNP